MQTALIKGSGAQLKKYKSQGEIYGDKKLTGVGKGRTHCPWPIRLAEHVLPMTMTEAQEDNLHSTRSPAASVTSAPLSHQRLDSQPII